ncbi:MAG: hypothetical protein QMD61_10170 [Methanobacterium sp.]|nr:hypothetical protein [Methanobacterium sp.]
MSYGIAIISKKLVNIKVFSIVCAGVKITQTGVKPKEACRNTGIW